MGGDGVTERPETIEQKLQHKGIGRDSPISRNDTTVFCFFFKVKRPLEAVLRKKKLSHIVVAFRWVKIQQPSSKKQQQNFTCARCCKNCILSQTIIFA